MIQRIIEIRKYYGLNQEQFAEKLKLSRSFINQIEVGKRNVSDRTITDICREFHVSETWLRTGEGEMFTAVSRSEEIAGWIGNILTDEQADFKRRFVSVLARLTEDEWELIERKARELLAGQEKEEGGD